MKKTFLCIVLITLAAMHVMAAKVYFVNTPKWTTVKAYMWTNGGEMSWPGQNMTQETGLSCTKGDVYSIDTQSYKMIIFNCGGNQCKTNDLTLDADRPYWCDEVAYASLEEVEKGVTPPSPGSGSAVPSECEDVMLQGFYWDSHMQNAKFGRTKWIDLQTQVNEIGQFFTLIWLPPSAKSQGGLGYHPVCYSDQNGDLGTKPKLTELIDMLHEREVKVVADIVINHCAGATDWCHFATMNFGDYGTFYPQPDWITANDEVNTSPSAGNCYQCSKTKAHQDEGDNWDGARDWDHQNENVQKMCKAYTQWMINWVQYDGFRYDMCAGFSGKHIDEYNQASKPYFSVMEYWKGTAGEEMNKVKEANHNTLTFDFAAKYGVFRDGIYKKNYSKLLRSANNSLRGLGYERYAVTFIDNHDTFARKDNEDIAQKKDGSSVNDKDLMMRANAYLLSMPGVPCVCYPHWVTYKQEIGAMITARRIAQVHSESKVDEEAGSGYYKATVHGKSGKVVLYLGSAAAEPAPAGYKTAVRGDSYAMYYYGNGHVDLEEIGLRNEDRGRRILYKDRIVIQVGENQYDIFGNKVLK